MSRARSAARFGCLLAAFLLLVSCSARRPIADPHRIGVEKPVGLYKARFVGADGEQRRFRLWLFAELPDRLHGEVLSALGTTEMIVDGGGGQLSIALIRDRVAFVGPAEPAVIEALLGVRLGLGQLVGLLLTGAVPDGDHEVTRIAAAGVVLPDELRIRSSDRQLSLRLKQRQALGPGGDRAGRGEPPRGMELRTLEELDLLDLHSGG